MDKLLYTKCAKPGCCNYPINVKNEDVDQSISHILRTMTSSRNIISYETDRRLNEQVREFCLGDFAEVLTSLSSIDYIYFFLFIDGSGIL